MNTSNKEMSIGLRLITHRMQIQCVVGPGFDAEGEGVWYQEEDKTDGEQVHTGLE